MLNSRLGLSLKEKGRVGPLDGKGENILNSRPNLGLGEEGQVDPLMEREKIYSI